MSDYDGRGYDPPYPTESETMILDTRHRDDGGNYIADREQMPTEVWFANGRHVEIEYSAVKSEIEGGKAYLVIDRKPHPAFAAMESGVQDHKYLNAECGLTGCQWLVAQHQVDVYRKRMADMEDFVRQCASDKYDRISPGMKAEARKLLEAPHSPTSEP